MKEVSWDIWITEKAIAYLKEYRAQIMVKTLVSKAINNYDLEFLRISFEVLQELEHQELIYQSKS